MSRARPFALAAALVLPALTLGGCISLFPKQTPAQLYRFDAEPSQANPQAGERIDIVAPPVSVNRAAATDQILAITGGQQAAFIASARWISPAAILWDETVRRAFAGRSTGVRLLTRTELAGGRGFLRIDVPTFEVRYAAAGAVPTAQVVLHATLAHRSGAFSAERTFTASVPAAEDRVSAIVPAFDRAVEQVVAQLVPWADANAQQAAVEVPAFPGAPSATVTRSTTTSTSTTVRPSPRP